MNRLDHQPSVLLASVASAGGVVLEFIISPAIAPVSDVHFWESTGVPLGPANSSLHVSTHSGFCWDLDCFDLGSGRAKAGSDKRQRNAANRKILRSKADLRMTGRIPVLNCFRPSDPYWELLRRLERAAARRRIQLTISSNLAPPAPERDGDARLRTAWTSLRS
jgi:hypothetical protein